MCLALFLVSHVSPLSLVNVGGFHLQRTRIRMRTRTYTHTYLKTDTCTLEHTYTEICKIIHMQILKYCIFCCSLSVTTQHSSFDVSFKQQEQQHEMQRSTPATCHGFGLCNCLNWNVRISLPTTPRSRRLIGSRPKGGFQRGMDTMIHIWYFFSFCCPDSWCFFSQSVY